MTSVKKRRIDVANTDEHIPDVNAGSSYEPSIDRMDINNLIEPYPPHGDNFASTEILQFPKPNFDLGSVPFQSGDGFFWGLSGPQMFDLDVDAGNFGSIDLDDGSGYNLEADLNEWVRNQELQSCQYNQENDFGAESSLFVQEEEVSRQEPCDMIMSDSFESDRVVCYGMLHSLDTQMVGNMNSITSKLDSCSTSYLHLKLTKQQESVVFEFPDDGTGFGYPRSEVSKIIGDLDTLPGVECHPMAVKSELREILGRAHGGNQARAKVSINVYGPKNMAAIVSKKLSDGKLWLQNPNDSREGVSYDNPHYLHLKVDSTEADEMINAPQSASGETRNRPTRGDQLRQMVEEVYRSVDNTRHLEMVDGGTRVKSSLLGHQQEALGFMLERESGNVDKRYKLWQKVENGSRTEYQHLITKARRQVKPEERGGGILADEMGMGKSLSVLALMMKTLDDGQKRADDLNNDQQDHARINYSRSTLIVVSSSLLIANWINEINKHLEDGVKVIKYHGQQRPKDLSKIQDSDVVITTYSTLAMEYQMLRMNQSPLHRIGWYRVVLDEAHIIRRPSATFHQSCAKLHADSRWCLTGTPIQNKLGDLGALLSFIRAEPFDKASVFRRWIETAFELTVDDPARVKDRLIMLLEAFCLRRTKHVLKLPPLRQTLRTLSFSLEEQKQYENTQGIMMRTIKQRVGEGESQSTFGLFQANMQLRIICNHGTYQKPFSWLRCSNRDQREAVGYTRGSGAEFKCSGCLQPMPILGSSLLDHDFEDQCAHVLCSECIDQSTTSSSSGRPRRCPVCVNTLALARGNEAPSNRAHNDGELDSRASMSTAMEDRDDYFDSSGHSTKMKNLVSDLKVDLWTTKSIIFSCWTRTLDLIARHLELSEIPYRRIDGNTPLQKRQNNLEEFDKGDEEPVLIMTTGTGAFGLNLTCANRIFIVELQWNPSVENQAIARAIRLGQKKEVRVVRYIIKGTVEEEMRKQQQWKKQIAAIGFEEVPDLIDLDMNSY